VARGQAVPAAGAGAARVRIRPCRPPVRALTLAGRPLAPASSETVRRPPARLWKIKGHSWTLAQAGLSTTRRRWACVSTASRPGFFRRRTNR